MTEKRHSKYGLPVMVLLVSFLLPLAAVGTEVPQLLNADLDEWSNNRLAHWVYVPYSDLEVKKSDEVYEEKPVIDVFHPKLGFLQQDYVPVSSLRAGDMLTLSVFAKSDPKADVDLSFLLLYGSGEKAQRKYKKTVYRGEGDWQQLQVTWIVSEKDLEDLSKVTVHFSVAKAETAVQLSSFEASVVNVGLSRNALPAGTVEVAWAHP